MEREYEEHRDVVERLEGDIERLELENADLSERLRLSIQSEWEMRSFFIPGAEPPLPGETKNVYAGPFELRVRRESQGVPDIHSVCIHDPDGTFVGRWRTDVGFEGSAIPPWIALFCESKCRQLVGGPG